MWRYIKGVEPPQKRSLKTPEEKADYNHDYEKTKRVRSYHSEWEKDRPWLSNSTEKGMVCSVCQKYGDPTSNSFVSGCNSYKLDSVTKHEKTKSHEKSAAIAKAKSESNVDSDAFKILKTLNAENFEKLSKMFRTCHGMVKNNRPISDFLWLCQLDEMKGLSIGQTYRNVASAKMFINAIAEVEFNKVTAVIKESQFMCLIGDGSCDASVKEQEMWFLRTAAAGRVAILFLVVHNTEKANAENIVSGIKQLVHENLGLEYADVINKTVALACDGASVMVGCRAGVGALLKNDQPSMITLHCMAHRLELALKDSTKKLKLYDKSVTVLCMGLYYVYHNSALNRAMLVRSFDALKTKTDKLLIPSRTGGTRWIGHSLRSISSVITSYRFFVAHLGQLTEPVERVSVDSKAKAKAYLKLLQSDGPFLRKVINATQFEGTPLKFCNIQEFTATRRNFLENIVEALEKRFHDFSSPTVVQASKIADFRLWPDSLESLKEFGDNDLQTLLDHFEKVLAEGNVNIQAAELEWGLLKQEVHDLNILSENPDWSTIQQRFGNDGKFSNIFGVINLILTLSPSSAEAERGFSQLKLLKTELRTNLGQCSLNNCFAIKLLSPCINSFNPEESVNYWVKYSTRSRRPNLKDKSSTSATSCNVIVDLVQQPSTSSQSEIVQSEIDSATAMETDCDIPCCDTDRGVNREQDINNILDKMEDLRQDIFDDSDDDKDYDSDEIEDSIVQKLLSSTD